MDYTWRKTMEQKFDIDNLRLYAFLEQLSSANRVPGGEGALILSSAMAAALGRMVSNLTIGKKKYAEYEEDVTAILAKAGRTLYDLLDILNEDARNMEPLLMAMRLPSETASEKKKKKTALEDASYGACHTPITVMEMTMRYLRLLDRLEKEGTTVARSDVGVSAMLCRAVIEGSAFNIFANTKRMQDRDRADALIKQAEGLIAEERVLADDIVKRVEGKLR